MKLQIQVGDDGTILDSKFVSVCHPTSQSIENTPLPISILSHYTHSNHHSPNFAVQKTFGCGSAIASSSVATEWVKGKSVDEVLAIKNSDIASHLKLPPVKLHCSMLAEDAIRAAVADWKTKQDANKNNSS